MSAAVRSNNGHVEAALYAKLPVTHSIFFGHIRRFTNYSIVNAELEKKGHLGQHSTSELKWDPSNVGDVCQSVRAFFGLPGLQRNVASGALASRQNDAYWCQSVGYAFIKSSRMTVGIQNAIILNGRNLHEQYQLQCPDAQAPIDPNVGRYKTESQLKQASAGNQILTVPLLFSLLHPQRPDRAWKVTSMWQTPSEIALTLRPIVDVTCNLYAVSLVPYLRGTSTVVASADISVRMFGTFFILDSAERDDLAYETVVQPVMNISTHEYTSTEAAGRQISFKPDFNHACRCVQVYVLPDAYVDGSTYSPCGVGIKNYFDYSASNHGEQLYELDFKLNTQSQLGVDVPPVEQRHHSWVNHYNKRPYQMIYLIPFSTRLDSDDINHTVNLSGFDSKTVLLKKNTSDACTIVAEAHVYNAMISGDGQAGMPFGDN